MNDLLSELQSVKYDRAKIDLIVDRFKEDELQVDPNKCLIRFALTGLQSPQYRDQTLETCSSIYYMFLTANWTDTVSLFEILLETLGEYCEKNLSCQACTSILNGIVRKNPSLVTNLHFDAFARIIRQIEPNLGEICVHRALNRIVLDCFFRKDLFMEQILYLFMEKMRNMVANRSDSLLLEYLGTFFNLITHQRSACQKMLNERPLQRRDFLERFVYHRRKKIRLQALIVAYHLNFCYNFPLEGMTYFKFTQRYAYLPSVNGMLCVRHYTRQQFLRFPFIYQTLQFLLLHKSVNINQKVTLFKISKVIFDSVQFTTAKAIFLQYLLTSKRIPLRNFVGKIRNFLQTGLTSRQNQQRFCDLIGSHCSIHLLSDYSDSRVLDESTARLVYALDY